MSTIFLAENSLHKDFMEKRVSTFMLHKIKVVVAVIVDRSFEKMVIETVSYKRLEDEGV